MRRHLLAPVAGIALLAACSDTTPGTGPECASAPRLSEAPSPLSAPSPFDAEFRRAAAEFGVPVELLRSIGYVETRWEMVRGGEEFPGLPPAFGVMALRGERLRRGAELAGVSEEATRTDPAANIRAAAALLRGHAGALGIRGEDPEDWAPAVARFSGIDSPEGQASYVRDGVYRALRGGAAASRSSAGPPCKEDPPTNPNPSSPVEHPGAVWRPSPNFNERTTPVHMVIVHTCEGSYAGCWSWLANPASGVSAHYVVREDGAEITQLVAEAKRAWHIGATYDCNLNGAHECSTLHGVQSNHFTIGVEHAGYASQTSWPAAQIDTSAKLVCEVTKRWQIPRDRFHIVGHAQLQPYNRTDPGANWPWAEYLARIDAHCAG
ncbi:MAG TPA: peptidoglycan recognition family protein [Longimicrobiaceae bacterium]|nr:peptidoglycan recognition family protein [Longimicrobiaceae bacterium]